MRLAVGFPLLQGLSWFDRPPSLGAWMALAGLVAMIGGWGLVRHRRPRKPAHSALAIREDHLQRVWLTVALLPVGLALLSDADPLALAWWLIAGPAFAAVLLVSAGLVILLLIYADRTLRVRPPQCTGTALVFCIMLLSTLCIPIGFVIFSGAAGWDPRASLTYAMCIAYLLAVLGNVLADHFRDSKSARAP